MADDRLPKRAVELREQGRRRRGRPRLWWEDCGKRDVRKAGEEEDWKSRQETGEVVKKLRAAPHPWQREKEDERDSVQWRRKSGRCYDLFSFGVTRMDKIRNDYIRGTVQEGDGFGEKTREARRRWYGLVWRKDDGYTGRRMLRMELPGKRKTGRAKTRFMDAVREDMAVVEVTEEDAEGRNKWRWKIRWDGPWRRSRRKKNVKVYILIILHYVLHSFTK